MTEHVASRTLVKSPPELWAECSDAASLARHLDQFGDIKITRLDPETAVAWEGERARGTVRIEPAGWGTKVILTAVAAKEEKHEEAPAAVEVVEPTVEVPAEPEALEQPDAVDAEADEVAEAGAETTTPTGVASAPRRRRFPRLFRSRREPAPAEQAVEAEQPSEQPAEPEPVADGARETPAEPEPDPAPEPTLEETAADTAPEMTEAALTAALDSLGQAHHRPYSRA